MTPHHLRCRRCYSAATGADLFDFAARPLSYRAVLAGESAESMEALLGALERRHRNGVTEWCTRCHLFGVAVFPLLASQPPSGEAAAEHLLGLRETQQLLELAV